MCVDVDVECSGAEDQLASCSYVSSGGPNNNSIASVSCAKGIPAAC